MAFVSSRVVRPFSVLAALVLLAPAALAQAPLDPLQRPYLPPMDGPPKERPKDAPARRDEIPMGPIDEKALAVEREELAPVMAADGSGLPYELWRGLSSAQLEAIIGALDVPPRSAALAALWRRLITADVPASSGSEDEVRFLALRIDLLDRSGLIDEAAALIARDPGAARDPTIATLSARSEIGLGNHERGCEIQRATPAPIAELPAYLKADAVLIAGYCAALAGDTTAVALSAGLARELIADGAGADALDVAPGDAAAVVQRHDKVSLLDYRILEFKGGLERRALIAKATPELLSALAYAPSVDHSLRLMAGEAGAAANAVAVEDLAALYRASPADGGEPSAGRAALFKAAEQERTPMKKARLIRELLDDARRAGLYGVALKGMAKPALDLAPVAELGWFAETAIETGLAAQDFELARTWASFGSGLDQNFASGGLAHWAALADIADPAAGGRSAHLDIVERMAASGRFEPMALNRLATVLDALDISVPIPLWELASRAPQPAAGHLPDTGVLSALADASQKREFGRTVLLAMQALGANGAAGAHVIALGDAIRALKRAGLAVDAHRLGFEALFESWPRAVSN